MMILDLAGKTPRQPLQLADGELRGVYHYAALGTAVWDIHHGALPRHVHGQRYNLVHGHFWMIANSSLAGPGPGCAVRGSRQTPQCDRHPFALVPQR